MSQDLTKCNTVLHVRGPGVRIVRRHKAEVLEMAKAVIAVDPTIILYVECKSRIGSQKLGTWKIVSERLASDEIRDAENNPRPIYNRSSQINGNALASCG